MRRGHAREQARQVRAVRRLLALPGLQVHQEGRPAAAGPAPVRGGLPEEQRRPSRPASRPAHRERLLGMLQLPALRLHDSNDEPLGGLHDADDGPLARKGDAALCLKCGSAIEATPDSIVPGVRVCGRSAQPGGARPAGARPAAGLGRRHRQERRPGSRPGPVGRAVDGPTRPARRAGRGRVSGVATRPCDQPGTRPLPPVPRRARRVAAHPARLRDRRRRVPRLAGRARHGLARPDTGRPARLPRGARRGPGPLVGRAAARGHPLVPPLGGARTASRPATRGVRSRRRGCPRRLPRVLEVDAGRARSSTRSSTRSSPRAATATDPEPAHGPDGARAARPRARRDRVRGRAAHQRAGGRGPRLARPAPRRDPRPRQGPQGADRAAGAPGARGRSTPISRMAARSCSPSARRRSGTGRRRRRSS